MADENKKENLNVVKEVNVSSSTPIAYNGTVKVQIKRGNKIVKSKIIKNKGYTQMFKFLAKCLYGLLDSSLAPEYIVLLGNDNAILSNVVKSSNHLLDDNGLITSYQFIIPFNAIISQGTCTKIVLTNNACSHQFSGSSIDESTLENNSCAIVELRETIPLSSLNNNDAILIVWSMEISSTLVQNNES